MMTSSRTVVMWDTEFDFKFYMTGTHGQKGKARQLINYAYELIASAGRGHKHHNVVVSVAMKTLSLEPANQEFVTQKRPIFHEKEVGGCMPKGRRHSSAPSRYVNNQPLFHSLGCSTVTRP
ncbi:hypothetical protein LXL04_004531 [Taraxacum kok-saghyz]